MPHHLDFWIPVAGLILASAGAAFLLVSILLPKKKLADQVNHVTRYGMDTVAGRIIERDGKYIFVKFDGTVIDAATPRDAKGRFQKRG